MYHAGEVWIGTVDGYLMLYGVVDQAEMASHSCLASPTGPNSPFTDVGVEVSENSGDSSPDSTGDASLTVQRYPPGKRLSPIHNLSPHAIPPHRYRHQMYYIPTATETQVEETTTRNEFPDSERQTRKISVKIDQASRKYSLSFTPSSTTLHHIQS